MKEMVTNYEAPSPSKKGQMMVKAEGLVRQPPTTVLWYLWNVERKPVYDKNMRKIDVVEELTTNCVVHFQVCACAVVHWIGYCNWLAVQYFDFYGGTYHRRL